MWALLDRLVTIYKSASTKNQIRFLRACRGEDINSYSYGHRSYQFLLSHKEDIYLYQLYYVTTETLLSWRNRLHGRANL